MKALSLALFLLTSSAFGQTWQSAWSFDGDENSPMGETLGFAVSGGADFDADGFDDFILGAPSASFNGILLQGAVYVISGRDGSLLFDIHDPSIPSGWLGAFFGASVAWIEDLNADGTPDILVGAPEKETPSSGDGEVSIYSGVDGSLIRTLVRSSIYITGFGSVVGRAGDYDGDGTQDILVGAPYTIGSTWGTNGAFLIYSGATGAELLRVDGFQDSSTFGGAVSYAGDLDLDGIPDYVVGAAAFDIGSAISVGQAYVISGASGTVLHQYTGNQQQDRVGSAVSGGTDFNGDSVPDFLISASGAPPFGETSIYSGSDGSLLYQVTGEASSGFGESIAQLGDLDGDGTPDFAIGAPWFNHFGSIYTAEGSVYLFSGSTGTLIERLDGSHEGQQLGNSLDSAGDITLSGTTSILAGGAGYSSAGGSQVGMVEVFFDSSVPSAADDDGDGLWNFRELGLGTNTLDQDSDDDGLSDGEEHFGTGPNIAALTDPLLADSDGDGIQDGTELGLATIVWTGNLPGILGTDASIFQPDLDPTSQTNPLNTDSDGGLAADGDEDVDHNGRVDLYETDPNNPSDDRIPGSLLANWSTISASQSQVTILELDFGINFALHQYRILGSMTGTSPGIAYQGVAIPLVFDSFTAMLVGGPAPLPLVYFSGTLDAQGGTTAFISTRPNEVSAFVGQSIYFAAVSIDPSSQLLTNSTTALTLDVVP